MLEQRLNRIVGVNMLRIGNNVGHDVLGEVVVDQQVNRTHEQKRFDES